MAESSTRRPTNRTSRGVAGVSRVALPTAAFWLAKGLSTALGEAVSDWSVNAWVPELAVLLGFLGFAAALLFQLTRRRYTPWAYWAAVAMVGIFGTMAADVAHVVLRAPYAVSFLGYGGLLALLFVLWRRREGTVDVHDVTTASRELFYWGAVVLTFAMGTALGDLTAVTLHLGYLRSAMLFAGLIAVPALGFRFLSWNAVGCFWAAYTVTRPLGASVADWLGKPLPDGGLGIGAGLVGVVLAVAMAAVVTVISKRAQSRPGPAT
ncbi:MAG TPA: hypothetical protein VGN48_04320 [Pedococcus sp.]|nr:hypothetical protein [Pedococcus sp.]